VKGSATVVQSHWQPERLGNLGKWLSGGTPSMAKPDYWGGDIPWVSPKDMKRSRLWDTIDRVTAKALGNGTRLAPSHSLLLVVRGMILAHAFPVARAETPLAFNQDIKALVLREDIDSEYLLWWLRSHESMFLGITTESTHGTKRLPTDELHGVEINLPSLPEQRAIAAALNDVDALLGGLDRLIAKKRDLKQAAMQQLLTGQTRLPGFQETWRAKSLGELCSLKSGQAITAANIDDHSPFPCFGGNGLRGCAHTYTHDGDFALIGRQGALCGNVIGVKGKFFASEHALVVTARSGISIAWLTYVLNRMNLNQYSESSAQPGLSAAKLLLLDVWAPPSEAEQAAIAAILSEMDTELAALEARRDKTRALKQGMMQELLTGRTRLV
jgi:type I restriction enzyme S subunit